MLKRNCLIIVVICLLFTQAPVSVSAEADSLQLVVNSADISEAHAFKRNDTIYIPFRAVFEHLGIPFEYDAATHSISYNYQDEPYLIDINEEIIYTPNGDYQLLIPLLMINQRTFIPQEFVMDLLRLEVHYDEKRKKLLVNSMDFSHSAMISSLANSYYKRDIPGYLLFTFNADPYGSLFEYFDTTEEPVLTEVVETTIGIVKYKSITEASVIVSKLSTTPAVKRYLEEELHFLKEGEVWKIDKHYTISHQITLLDDVEEKVAALMDASPVEVEKVLNDLQANYDALKGNDVEAAINTYSPLYIDEWNRRVYFTWESIVEHSIMFPSSKEDLLDARVIYLDDDTAVVHAKLLYTQLPQTYGGLYEPVELDDPHEYEVVLYLDHTNGDRWTFNMEDQLEQIE